MFLCRKISKSNNFKNIYYAVLQKTQKKHKKQNNIGKFSVEEQQRIYISIKSSNMELATNIYCLKLILMEDIEFEIRFDKIDEEQRKTGNKLKRGEHKINGAIFALLTIIKKANKKMLI